MTYADGFHKNIE